MKIDQALIDRYLKNQCSPREARKVLTWFGTEEGKKVLNKLIDQDLENTQSKNKFLIQTPSGPEKMLKRIYQQAEKDTFGRPVAEDLKNRNFQGFANWHKAAAIALIFVFAGLAYLYTRSDKYIYYQTAFGETSEVTLPDGSSVILNGNTGLKFNNNWENQEVREVWVAGEAFFSVIHTQKDLPFFVYTSHDFNVEVLGTEFNVKARNTKTCVVLNTGSIQLNILEPGQRKRVTMAPGDMIAFENDPSLLVKKVVDPEIYSAWKDDKLIFDNTSIEEITILLKETYGLSVIVSDSELLKQKISGSTPNKDVDTLLDGLALLLDIEIITENGLVIFQNTD